eukprot:scaffold58725_cov31-Tisochrysis_lutea.AAC.3
MSRLSTAQQSQSISISTLAADDSSMWSSLHSTATAAGGRPSSQSASSRRSGRMVRIRRGVSASSSSIGRCSTSFSRARSWPSGSSELLPLAELHRLPAVACECKVIKS